MTLSSPRSLADFLDTLPISRFEWSTRENIQTDGQGSGQILQAQLGPDLWEVAVYIDVTRHAEARMIRARLNSLIPVGRTALIYDPIAKHPAADSDGSLIASSTVTLHTIGDDFDAIRLGGLPAGYLLTEGDKIEVQYGLNPVRRMILEVSEPAAAAGDGVTPLFAVYPHVRDGVTTAASVNLVKPALKMVRLSHDAGRSVAALHDGMQINFVEKVV